MIPYYESGGITIYLGDVRELNAGWLRDCADVLMTDPPYGIDYESGWDSTLDRSIAGDADTSVRDGVIRAWNDGGTKDRPAIIFGSWKRPRPAEAHTVLVWDKGPAFGMGDLSVPWKPNWEEIYVCGRGFSGRRDSGVITGHLVVSWASRGRLHPHEKPTSLMRDLISKCPEEWVLLDPFMGSGTTLRAAKDLNRKAIGIEISEAYCEVAAKRLAQEVFAL